MEQKLILFDIDGTLLHNETNRIPKSTIQAIQQLKAAGHQLAIATGRSFLEVGEQVRNLPFEMFITANGQYIVCHGKTVYEGPILASTVQRLVDEAKQMGIELGFVTPTKMGITNINKQMEVGFNYFSMPIPEIIPTLYQEEAILQVWFFSERFGELADKFKEELQFVPWVSSGADVLPVGASKAEGIKRLIKHLEVEPQQIIVFGDGHNDIEMLKFADIGVVMGQAAEEVKKHADFITKPVDEEGIYYACQQLNLF